MLSLPSTNEVAGRAMFSEVFLYTQGEGFHEGGFNEGSLNEGGVV